MFATLFAASLAVGGGAAWAQSTATPDTGAVLNGISTGAGRGPTGVGQGQSGTTRQNEGGPANTGRPDVGTAGFGAGRPSTGGLPANAITGPRNLDHATPTPSGSGGDQAAPPDVDAR